MSDVRARVPALPSGTVTFCFTDIEGSTRLIARLGNAEYEAVLERHRTLLRRAWDRHRGIEVRVEGDGSFVVFASASSAVAAAVDAQLALQGAEWPGGDEVRVRIGLHTGDASVTSDRDYVGLAVHVAARVVAAANGGQILASEETVIEGQPLPEFVAVEDLGSFRLRDVDGATRLFAVAHPDLRTIGRPPRAPSSAVRNLPIIRTLFVGRTEELKTIGKLLELHPLVTIVGPGGVGKTRLAIEAATAVTGDHRDGAWLVDLASVTDPELVVPRIADALALVTAGSGSPLEAVLAHLRAADVLLVVDNCEHLLDAVAAFVDEALSSCPSLTILATSREPLVIRGEITHRLEPLATPDHEDDGSTLGEIESVRLFCDRALLADPSFELDGSTASSVAQICRRLDGIPLALELAASGLRSSAVDVVASRLDDRFSSLGSGYRTDAPRQQTLRATIDWSFDLLDDDERALFRRLAAFRGGATLEAAQAVSDDDGSVIRTLASLVDRSLVVPADGRFTMLETIHAYATEKLDASDEADVVRERHRMYLAGFWRDRKGRRWDPDVIAELHGEFDNFRAALALRSDRTMLELCVALGEVWYVRGPLPEGVRWLRRALDANPDPSDLRAEALVALTNLATGTGDFDMASAALAEAIDWYRGADTSSSLAEAVYMRAEIALTRGQLEDALPDVDEAQRLAAVSGNDEILAKCEYAFAHLAITQARFDEAAVHAAAALDIFTRLGNTRQEARALTMAGRVEAARAELDAARDHFRRAVHLNEELKDDSSLGFTLWNLGAVEVARDDAAAGVSALSRAYRYMDDMGDVLAGLALADLAHARFIAGDAQRGWADIERAIERTLADGLGWGPAYVRMLRADMHLRDGDGPNALADARAAAARFIEMGSVPDATAALSIVAEAESAVGSHARALTLLEMVVEQQRLMGAAPDPRSAAGAAAIRDAARAALDDDAYRAASEHGRTMTFEDVAALALTDEGQAARTRSSG